MGNTEFVLIILLLLVTAGGVLFLALRQNRMELILRDLEAEDIQDELVRIRGQVESTARMNAEFNAQLRTEVNGSIREGMREQSDQLREGFRDQSGEQRRSAKEQMDAMRSAAKIQSEQLLSTSKLLTESLLNMSDSMSRQINESMERMQESNEKRLDKIEGVVDEKLDRTLNERLDTNFKMVGDQLGKLYRSLGELEALSSGVTDLNRTLSNVKTRGVWGEVQLGRILEQTMARSQYEINVATKKNSDDRVEFAVRFPSQDGTEDIVYLPIDAKFPSDLYNRIVEASENGDAEQVQTARAELRLRILTEARTIRDKYINPPATTNYAIMFLPTEGLYAEVLRIDGLTEKCQQTGVIVAGPVTVTAILNSLQAGFRNIMLSKKSVEVMKLLEAVKAQFAKLDEEVQKTQKKLYEAAQSTEKLQHRTQIIQKRMKKIGEMDPDEAQKLLAVEE